MNNTRCALVAAAIIAAGSAAAAETWRHGVVEAKGDAGILFMPVRFGEKYGVEIDMVQFVSSTVPVKALLAGEVDSYSTSPLVGIAAMAEGAPLRFVGCNWPGMTYNIYAKSDITSVEQLRGRSLGVSGPGSSPDLFAREVLHASGVDPAEVQFANAGGGGDRFRAVVAGIVEATATSSEYEEEAGRQNVNVIARAPEVTPNMLRNCIVTTQKAIDTKGEALVRFLAAQMEGHAYAMEHPDETYALAREIAHLPEDDTGPEFIFKEVVQYSAVTPELEMDVGKLQWNVDMMQRNGRIQNTFDITEFVDDGPRQQALELVKQQ